LVLRQIQPHTEATGLAMSIDLPTLGMRLREAREGRGLTRDQAAEAIVAPPTVVADIEAGRRSLSTLELSKLAKLYGRTVATFFADGQDPPTCDETSFTTLVRNADPMLTSQIIGQAVEAYRRDEVSQGWLRDLSDELGMPADELIGLAEADE
jgi:transcriptional regulator with XRE-family HTH domain